MYISKKDREIIKNKYGGKCAYTGTELLPDWQVDHVEPVLRNWWANDALFEKNHNIDNMVPCQKIINHYKHSMGLHEFRGFMINFHGRLKKYPKNPQVEKSISRKAYMMEIAELFGITPDNPFAGIFYFEQFTYD
jgi:hypothetical protein